MTGRGAGRGRGGGGRGGGSAGRGGFSRSLNHDQLTALGVNPAELTLGPVSQPPPLFPMLERRPMPLEFSTETDYQLMLKQDIIDRMQLSPSFLQVPSDKNSRSEQQIDRLVAQMSNVKEKFDWKMFPAELRPKAIAKKIVKTKTVKDVNIEEAFNKLHSMEMAEKSNEASEDVEEEEEEDEVVDDVDEEMDDGTDYANNYFDNGEAYEDEDDNMDDGSYY